jgi:hypothetical protein
MKRLQFLSGSKDYKTFETCSRKALPAIHFQDLNMFPIDKQFEPKMATAEKPSKPIRIPLTKITFAQNQDGNAQTQPAQIVRKIVTCPQRRPQATSPRNDATRSPDRSNFIQDSFLDIFLSPSEDFKQPSTAKLAESGQLDHTDATLLGPEEDSLDDFGHKSIFPTAFTLKPDPVDSSHQISHTSLNYSQSILNEKSKHFEPSKCFDKTEEFFDIGNYDEFDDYFNPNKENEGIISPGWPADEVDACLQRP